MSVNNILDAKGKILVSYLPSGPTLSNNYVDNPMTENLQGGNFNILNVGTLDCNKVVLDTLPNQLFGFGSEFKIPTGQSQVDSASFQLVPEYTYALSISAFSGANAPVGALVALDIVYPGGVGLQNFWVVDEADFNSSSSTVYTLNISFTVPAGVVGGLLRLKSTQPAGASGISLTNIQNCVLYQILNGAAP